jgi:hypothetical protein
MLTAVDSLWAKVLDLLNLNLLPLPHKDDVLTPSFLSQVSTGVTWVSRPHPRTRLREF